MSRSRSLLAVAAAVGLLASTRVRSRVSGALARRRNRLPKGVQEYPAAVVDRRGAAGDAPAPPRAETPAEIVTEFYVERGPS
jgi:hypothetical protein